jgi:hypothetical protein
MTITAPTAISSTLRNLETYKALTEKAQAARVDPNASPEYRESQYVKYRDQARSLAQEQADVTLYLGTAQTRYDRERAKVDGILQADPARVQMAWAAMQPLKDTGMSYTQLAAAATTPEALGALQVFAPPAIQARLKVLESGQIGLPDKEAETAILGEQLGKLTAAIDKAAGSVGVDNAGILAAAQSLAEAQATNALWKSLATIGAVTVAVTVQATQVSDELAQAIVDVAKHGTGMDHAVAAHYARQEVAQE